MRRRRKESEENFQKPHKNAVQKLAGIETAKISCRRKKMEIV
jgi:hypothetical protein